MSDHSGFSEHKVMLCLDKDLYRAFIRLQADKDLGRSYAGLLPYVEGLYRLGYLSKEIYEAHVKRYSEPLVTKEEKPGLSVVDKKRKEALENTDKILKGMVAQFDVHRSDSAWISKASGYAGKFTDKLESARNLLTKIQELETVESYCRVNESRDQECKSTTEKSTKEDYNAS